MQDSPVPCRHFRNKKMFISTQVASALSTEFDPNASSHCWCNKTLSEVGADDQLTSLEGCTGPGRSCYEPL